MNVNVITYLLNAIEFQWNQWMNAYLIYFLADNSSHLIKNDRKTSFDLNLLHEFWQMCRGKHYKICVYVTINLVETMHLDTDWWSALTQYTAHVTCSDSDGNKCPFMWSKFKTVLCFGQFIQWSSKSLVYFFSVWTRNAKNKCDMQLSVRVCVSVLCTINR